MHTFAKKFKFPKNFKWGTTTCAIQNEGGDVNSDYWLFEHTEGSPIVEKSGDTTDLYHRYPDDIKLMKKLGFNTWRFNIPWERIEPEEGEFSLAQIEHYRRMGKECLENGIEPVYCFLDTTFPRWVHNKGSWLWNEIPKYFTRYVKYCCSHLSDLMNYVVTINEPDLTAIIGYRFGVFPAGWEALKRGEDGEKVAETAQRNMVICHHKAMEVIKDGTIPKSMGRPFL